jgi:hypothetical protein
MKERIFVFLVLLSMMSVSSTLNAQWAHVYGNLLDDQAAEISPIQETRDGGFVVIASARTYGIHDDFWVLKLNVSGAIEWQRTYGGESRDTAYSVQQTRDGGYILAGATESFGASRADIWVLKINSTGDVEWQRRYGGAQWDGWPNVKEVDDGGYVIAGATESFGAGLRDIWIAKLSPVGVIEWQKTYGGSLDDGASHFHQTSDAGYIVAGHTESFGAGRHDVWVLKLDSSGRVEWQHTYGGSRGEVANSIQLTSDGGYVVAGFTLDFGRHGNMWVLKLTSSGAVQWQRAYGGDFLDYAWSVQQTRDEGYIVAGYTESFNQDQRYLDATVIKLNSSGDITWERTYGGAGDDLAWEVLQTRDGGYAIACIYQPTLQLRGDVLILKLASNGDIPGCGLIGFPTNIVHETRYSPSNTSVTPVNSSFETWNTNARSEGTDAVLSQMCPASMLRTSGKPDF